MNFVLQPDGTSLCGAACVAMVADVSLAEAVRACRCFTLYSPGVSVHNMRRGLDRLSVIHGKVLHYRTGKNRFRYLFPEFCIATMVNSNQSWRHAVVLKDGFIYDPGIGYPMPINVYEDIVVSRAWSFSPGGRYLKARWEDFVPILTRALLPGIVSKENKNEP